MLAAEAELEELRQRWAAAEARRTEQQAAKEARLRAVAAQKAEFLKLLSGEKKRKH